MSRCKGNSMRRTGFFIFFVSGLLFAATAHGAPFQPPGFPSLTSSISAVKSAEFCGERVPLEIEDVRERFEKEILLSLWDRPQVILWLKRSRRYLPHIEKMLKQSGLPDDLKFVAIAESALRRHAGSAKGAIGFWQFLPDTGRKYGLVINERVDERRSIFASTQAAIAFFKDLHEKFRSWSLAVAAYNMGEEGLMAEILEQKTSDYYHLYLPLETQRFVFRILSVKLILSDPEKYGFELGETDFYSPLAFDEVRFDCFEEIPIRIVAEAANTGFKVIKDLNPEIRGHHLPAGNHTLRIPEGASSGFRERYRTLEKAFLAARKERIYIVKKGDNLSSIAGKFNVPIASLMIWNRLDLTRPIHPGDRLTIHPRDEIADENIKP